MGAGFQLNLVPLQLGRCACILFSSSDDTVYKKVNLDTVHCRYEKKAFFSQVWL